MKTWIATALGAASLASAGGCTLEGSGRRFIGFNNWSVLAGDPLPAGTDDIAQLRKSLDVTLLGAPDGIRITTAYAGRSDPAQAVADRFIIPVRNDGDTPWCFVKAVDMRYLAGDASVLAEDPIAYVDGSVGDLDGVQTSTCLGPDEDGYFTMVEPLDWATVAAIDLTVEASDRSPANPDASVFPVGYSFDGSSDLAVAIENHGFAAATLDGGFSTYVLTDDAGVAAYWSYVKRQIEPASGSLPPMSHGSLGDRLVAWSGRSSRMVVHVDFEDAAAGGQDLSAVVAGSPGEVEAARDAREAQRERAVQGRAY